MTFDMFAARLKMAPQRSAEIKDWAAQIFRLNPDVPVLVAELRCTEPGCPPLETVIAILDVPGQPRQFKIHKATADVTIVDVLQAAQGGCSHGVTT